MSGERKILIIVENLPVPFDTRVWQEATTLVENGYTVSVVCPSGRGHAAGYECLSGVHVFRYRQPGEGSNFFGYMYEYMLSLFKQYKLARKIYREIGFDVIHACNPPDNIFLIANRFKRKGVDFVFDHHDLCPELYKAKFGRKGFLYFMMTLMEKMTFRSAVMSFSTNHSYRQIAITRGGMKEDRVFVLRSGPNLNRLRIFDPKDELKMGKRIMVGYVGVLGKQEGMDYLLKAAHHIKYQMKRDDILFVICGNGSYLQNIIRKSSQMGLDDTILFKGSVSDQILLDYLNTADICINPDEYNEMNDKSTMNKVLEYMALGKPIVQFDLVEGRNSAADASLYARRNDYIDLAEKITELADDRQKRERMGAIGKNRVYTELSWDHTKKALLDGYDYYFTTIRKRKNDEKKD